MSTHNVFHCSTFNRSKIYFPAFHPIPLPFYLLMSLTLFIFSKTGTGNKVSIIKSLFKSMSFFYLKIIQPAAEMGNKT